MSSMMDQKGNVPLQVGLGGGGGVNFYSFSTDNLCRLHCGLFFSLCSVIIFTVTLCKFPLF